MRAEISADAARTFISQARFVWHQRFELAPGIYTPGANDMALFLDVADVPDDLQGASVLDIGTANGGMAFELERRGAGRVVAVDIYDVDWFGFAQIKQLLGSHAEYIRKTVYELSSVLREPFDIVVFLGVLYHLRHPLLGLDVVRDLTGNVALIESAVCDREIGTSGNPPIIRFYRGDELGGDPSNWFAPSVTALTDWCQSSGLQPLTVRTWPEGAPSRCLVVAAPTESAPEYRRISYELPLTCSVARGQALPGARLSIPSIVSSPQEAPQRKD
jgi:tRNA (mo5U34)-methyltransferase